MNLFPARRFCLRLTSFILLFECTLFCLTGSRALQSCSETIRVPKIAFLFLARSGMPLASVWEPWFKSVAGMVPLKGVIKQGCNKLEEFLPPPEFACTVDKSLPTLKQQFLFSVYIHSSRHEFEDFPPGHLFEGTLIPEKVPTSWGNTIDATRAQLYHALKDPLNERFLTLSDTDAPLYPARMTYLQLTSEDQSRIAACKAWDLVNINRYTCRMAEQGVDVHHWRKGAQWLSLIRSHAEMIADDEIVRAAFNQHCAGVFEDWELGIHRGCLSDEHYYHTLIAFKEKERETDCKGSLSYSNFTGSFEGHPRTYTAEDISSNLIAAIRAPLHWLGEAQCGRNEKVWTTAREGFRSLPVELSNSDCDPEKHNLTFQPMETWCQLFARKFAADTAEPLESIFSSDTGEGNFAIYHL